MKLIEVIPIYKIFGKDKLSYFSSIDLQKGDLVSIEIRGKKSLGVTDSIKSIKEAKTEIKKSEYKIKKIEELKTKKAFNDQFIEAIKETAFLSAGSFGATIKSILPKDLTSLDIEQKGQIKIGESNLTPEKLVFQESDKDRIDYYKTHIRQEFAKYNSVFFCLPNPREINDFKKNLEKGIEEHTFSLHNNLKKKELEESIEKIKNAKHPVLIFATAGFLAMPRNDIGTIILEKENSNGYKKEERPFLDLRDFIEKYSEKIKAKLIFADRILRINTLKRYYEKELSSLQKPKNKIPAKTQKSSWEYLANENEMPNPKKEFEVFSEKSKALIEKAIEKQEKVFIFAPRKGLHSQTICQDCGQILSCKSCDMPMTLFQHKNEEEKYSFFCNHCKETQRSNVLCSNCQSWNLKPLGIGIQKVEKTLKEKCPKTKIIKIDKDSVKTEKQADKKSEEIRSSEGPIIILGTEMAVNLIDQVQTSIISSIDPLLSIPGFSIKEKIFSLMDSIKAKTSGTFILQSRKNNAEFFDQIIQGDIYGFYKQEIQQRQKFDYPPFSCFVKITLKDEKSEIKNKIESFKKEFAEFEPVNFPAFIPRIKNKYIENILIKTKPEMWQKQNPEHEKIKILVEKLKNLPPYFQVKTWTEDTLL